MATRMKQIEARMMDLSTEVDAAKAELTTLRAHAERLAKALEPFARYVHFVGDTPPPGNSDVIYAYHNEKGCGEIRHRHCNTASTALTAYSEYAKQVKK